jgi:uncharacterized membrane-anchored protein
MTKRSLYLIGFNVVLIAIVFTYQVFSKSDLLHNGDVIYLKIAPRDPRSFMMGDYMELSYDVEEQLRNQSFLRQGLKITYNSKKHLQIAVKCDSTKLVTSARISYDGKTKPGEYLLHGQESFWSYSILPNEYLFQEGRAAHFGKAVYAQFRVDKKGNAIIECLLDKNFKRLK